MATLFTLNRQSTRLNWDARSNDNWPDAFKAGSSDATMRLWRWNDQRFGLGAVGYGKRNGGGNFFNISANAWSFRLGLADLSAWFHDRTYTASDFSLAGQIDTDEIYLEGNLPPANIEATLILAILDATDLATISADTSRNKVNSARSILDPSPPPPDPGPTPSPTDYRPINDSDILTGKIVIERIFQQLRTNAIDSHAVALQGQPKVLKNYVASPLLINSTTRITLDGDAGDYERLMIIGSRSNTGFALTYSVVFDPSTSTVTQVQLPIVTAGGADVQQTSFGYRRIDATTIEISRASAFSIFYILGIKTRS